MLKFAAILTLALGLGMQLPAMAADSPPATTTAPVVKVGNTKCVVTGEDLMGKGATITFEGKEYNLCCKDCVGDFKADPAKFVKAFDKDPAKFGVPAAKGEEKK